MALPSFPPLRPSRRTLLLLMTALLLTHALASIVSEKQSTAAKDAGSLSLAEIDAELEECPIHRSLTAHKRLHTPATPSTLAHLFTLLFPSSSPAINALLATAYISGPPNFLLAFCPPNIDPSSLSLMVAFAVGGLLGDTIFHLLPEIFLGEEEGEGVRFVLVEPNRNLLLGVGIIVGFAVFMAVERGLRILTGGGGHDHSHGKQVVDEAKTSGVDPAAGATGELKRRGKKEKSASVDEVVEEKQTVKLGGYLNLIADFTHNITDGLALSTSFYTSPTLGATTTLAVFFHEIPHEVGDFALLIQSGFSKRAALGAQFVTAVGAFLGTFIGIAVQEWGGSAEAPPGRTSGIWGTSLAWGDMLLPFTAGTFLYVGTVAVIPELLEMKQGGSKAAEWRRMGGEFVAMGVGAGVMLLICAGGMWQERQDRILPLKAPA